MTFFGPKFIFGFKRLSWSFFCNASLFVEWVVEVSLDLTCIAMLLWLRATVVILHISTCWSWQVYYTVSESEDQVILTWKTASQMHVAPRIVVNLRLDLPWSTLLPHTATDWPKCFCIYRLKCSKATISGWLDGQIVGNLQETLFSEHLRC